MDTDPLVRAVKDDPEGRAEWSARQVLELWEAAGNPRNWGYWAGSDPVLIMGQRLSKHPAFGRRVVTGKSRWHLLNP